MKTEEVDRHYVQGCMVANGGSFAARGSMKAGDKVMVREYDDHWGRRIYSHPSPDGRGHHCYIMGGTAWTSRGATSYWMAADVRPATKEELER